MDMVVIDEVEKCVSVKSEDDLSVLGPSRPTKGKSNKKATNEDLPFGALPAYRHDVVPSIWHWAAGNVPDPFNISERDLIEALDIIWTHVYVGRVAFDTPTLVSLVSVLRPNSVTL